LAIEILAFAGLIDPSTEQMETSRKWSDLVEDTSRVVLLACTTADGVIPEEDEARLRQLIDRGGYEATHALIGLQMFVERWGHSSQAMELIQQALIRVYSDLSLARKIDDLRLEQFAVLTSFGCPGMLTCDDMTDILGAQNQDGSWTGDRSEESNLDRAGLLSGSGSASSANRSHWHATILGWWTLLAATSGSRPLRFSHRNRPGTPLAWTGSLPPS
jgi:hypothetical protein